MNSYTRSYNLGYLSTDDRLKGYDNSMTNKFQMKVKAENTGLVSFSDTT